MANQEYFGLFLNPMTGRCEDRVVVFTAKSQQALLKLLRDNLVEPYEEKGIHPVSGKLDHLYRKTFKKGSPLEWFNPPYELPHDKYQFGILSIGTEEQHMDRSTQVFHQQVIAKLLPEDKITPFPVSLEQGNM